MITREPIKAAAHEHDLLIVGGGIYGACVALEAARRGLRPVLLERGDFGEATSWNSLRILHGGLRYLQTLDVRRFRESVSERRWFCRTFPDLVQPQECLMPLYGEGLKRPVLFGAALLVNDLLSCDRNAGVEPAKRIERGRILDVAETISRFPLADRRDLRGAGLWHDAKMLSSQRVLIEILHWACRLGATALNYVQATGLVTHKGVIHGVEARDTIDGRTYLFPTRVVCNCAGPWSGELAARFDAPASQFFRPSLAFNVLLDCEPPSASAVAVAPRRPSEPSGPVYFLYPAFGRLLAGTVHVPWKSGPERVQPTEEQIRRFVVDLNVAIPGLNVRLEQVVRVFAGLLPVTEDGTANLAVRPTIRDHGREGGPEGLVSVSGVKFTTARLVAQKTLAVLSRHLGPVRVRDDAGRAPIASNVDFDRPWSRARDGAVTIGLRKLVQDEAVMTIDDLLFRRTHWAITEPDVNALRRRVSDALGWNERQASQFVKTMPNQTPWQLRMFSRTLKKKLRLAALRNVLGRADGQRCLLVTCGDNNGAINYRLRELGGRWSWADCEDKSIREMSELLGEEVQHVAPGQLPYPGEHFDCVVTIDVHEHLRDPEAFTREVRRVLKPGGRAVVTVPGGDPRKVVNRLKNAVGMTREKYGHVRDGFSVPELRSLMHASDFEFVRALTFSRFFTELIELGINFMYVKKLSKASVAPVTEGTIAPATADQLRSVRKTYRLYSIIYPFVWLASQLDWLLIFTPGYVVLVEGRKQVAS